MNTFNLKRQTKFKDLFPKLDQAFIDDPKSWLFNRYPRGYGIDVLNALAFRSTIHSAVYVSQQTLANQVDCHRRTIIRWLPRLIKDGFIQVIKRFKKTSQGWRNDTNLYYISDRLLGKHMILKAGEAIKGLALIVHQTVTQLNIIENNNINLEIDTPSYGYRWEELQDVTHSTNILDNWTLQDIRNLAPKPKQKIENESMRSNEPPDVQSVGDLFASLGLSSSILSEALK